MGRRVPLVASSLRKFLLDTRLPCAVSGPQSKSQAGVTLCWKRGLIKDGL